MEALASSTVSSRTPVSNSAAIAASRRRSREGVLVLRLARRATGIPRRLGVGCSGASLGLVEQPLQGHAQVVGHRAAPPLRDTRPLSLSGAGCSGSPTISTILLGRRYFAFGGMTRSDPPMPTGTIGIWARLAT